MTVDNPGTAFQCRANPLGQGGTTHATNGLLKRKAHGGGNRNCIHIEKSVDAKKMPASGVMGAPGHRPTPEMDNGKLRGLR